MIFSAEQSPAHGAAVITRLRSCQEPVHAESGRLSLWEETLLWFNHAKLSAAALHRNAAGCASPAKCLWFWVPTVSAGPEVTAKCGTAKASSASGTPQAQGIREPGTGTAAQGAQQAPHGKVPHVQAVPAGCLPESPGRAEDGCVVSNSDLLNRLIKALENYTGTQLHRRLIGVCQEAFWHASTLLAQERSAAEPCRAFPQQPSRCC